MYSPITKIQKNNTRGFTLIELLVVIAIIGVLSSVIVASLNTAHGKAGDATRKTEMRQMQRALEMYYSGHGIYPSTGNQWFGVQVNGGSHSVSGTNAYIPGLTPKYMTILPIDPKGITSNHWLGYLYRSDGTNYALLSHEAPNSYPTAGEPFYDPVRPTWAWKVCSGLPACNW